jgi:ABC-type polysaccharide/polyol phosphate export permease
MLMALVHRPARAIKLDLLFYLARMEFVGRHAGSAAGMLWSLAAPVGSILVIWAALSYGLGMRAQLGPGYGQELAAALAAWLFFSDCIVGATSAITGNPHLVKKIVFPVFLLPIASVMARVPIHLGVLAAVSLLVAGEGGGTPAHLVVLPAALLLLVAFSAAGGLLAASLNVVLRGTQAVVAPLLGLLFWLTPIVWPIANIPDRWHPLVYANPLAGLIEVYRFAVLGRPFSVHPLVLVTGGPVFLLISWSAVTLYRRLRPVFADVL